MKRLVVFLFMLLISCNSAKKQPLKCEQIVDTKIVAANWDSLNRETIQKWIKTNYPSVSTVSENSWTFAGRYHYMAFDPKLRYIEYELTPLPSLRELISCYGIPTWYEAKEAPNPEVAGVRFILWYPKKGLRFAWDEYGVGVNTELTEDTPFRSLIITKPGTLDEQVERIAGSAFKIDALKTIKPWPITTPIKIKVE